MRGCLDVCVVYLFTHFPGVEGSAKHNLPGGATRGRHRVTTGRCAGASRTGRHWNGEVGLWESELELKLLAAHQIPFLGVGHLVENSVASITTVSLRKRNYVMDCVLQGRHKSPPHLLIYTVTTATYNTWVLGILIETFSEEMRCFHRFL